MLGLATTTELRLAVYGVLLAAIGGWMAYERFHLIDEGEARELAKLQASSADLLAKAQANIAKETAQHEADNAQNQGMLDATLKANSVLSDTLDSRVRDFQAYRAKHPDVPRPTSGPPTASQGECGAQSCGDLAVQLAERGDDLARSNGELTAALQASQRDRDSLTGLPR